MGEGCYGTFSVFKRCQDEVSCSVPRLRYCEAEKRSQASKIYSLLKLVNPTAQRDGRNHLMPLNDVCGG